MSANFEPVIDQIFVYEEEPVYRKVKLKPEEQQTDSQTGVTIAYKKIRDPAGVPEEIRKKIINRYVAEVTKNRNIDKDFAEWVANNKNKIKVEKGYAFHFDLKTSKVAAKFVIKKWSGESMEAQKLLTPNGASFYGEYGDDLPVERYSTMWKKVSALSKEQVKYLNMQENVDYVTIFGNDIAQWILQDKKGYSVDVKEVYMAADIHCTVYVFPKYVLSLEYGGGTYRVGQICNSHGKYSVGTGIGVQEVETFEVSVGGFSSKMEDSLHSLILTAESIQTVFRWIASIFFVAHIVMIFVGVANNGTFPWTPYEEQLPLGITGILVPVDIPILWGAGVWIIAFLLAGIIENGETKPGVILRLLLVFIFYLAAFLIVGSTIVNTLLMLFV